MTDLNKQFQEMATAFGEQMKAAMPKVTFNKNGYEIRASVLELASQHVWQDYHAKWGEFVTSVEKDTSGNIVLKGEFPEVPGVDTVLAAAEKLYGFVNTSNK